MSDVKNATASDRRWLNRKEAWDKAERAKVRLSRNFDNVDFREEIVETCVAGGYWSDWSVWMTVFEDDADMRQRFIAAMDGTALDCFDAEEEFDEHMASDDDFEGGDINCMRMKVSDSDCEYYFPTLEVAVSTRGTILIGNNDDQDYIELSPLMAERLANKIFEVHGIAYMHYAKEMLKQAKKNLNDDNDGKRDDGLVC